MIGYFLPGVVREAKTLCPFLSKLSAQRSVSFGIVKDYMEKKCSLKKFTHNMCYKCIKKSDFKHHFSQQKVQLLPSMLIMVNCFAMKIYLVRNINLKPLLQSFGAQKSISVE